MKIFKKIFLILFFGCVIFVAFNFKHFNRFPRIISHWYAKEFCSCFYVMEQPENFCAERTRQWLPIQELKIDAQKKEIWVRGTWTTATARFEGPRYGCRLVDTPTVP